MAHNLTLFQVKCAASPNELQSALKLNGRLSRRTLIQNTEVKMCYRIK